MNALPLQRQIELAHWRESYNVPEIKDISVY
jgi:hypothetical protein